MIRTFAASLALVLACAADAHAGDLALSFGKQSRHGSFGISISSRGVGVGYGAPVQACRQAPRHVWVPGRYEVVHEKVWIDGRREKVRVAGHQRTVCDAYGRTRTVWEPSRWEIVERPGRWETRAVRVWQPGHYAPQPVVGYAHRGY